MYIHTHTHSPGQPGLRAGGLRKMRETQLAQNARCGLADSQITAEQQRHARKLDLGKTSGDPKTARYMNHETNYHSQ